MKTWLAQQARALSRALNRFTAAPLGTALNVCVISAALALPLGFYVVIDGLQSFAARDLANTVPQLRVYMTVDTERDDVAQTGERLRQDSEVAELVFVSREQALRDLRQSSDLNDVIDSLPKNPLPDAFIVTLRDPSPEALQSMREEVQRWPHVAQVQVDSAWAQRFSTILRIGRLVIAFIAILFAILLAAVSFNTIRMQILTQRDEIEIVKLIGATNAFIRRPLRYFGVLLGLVSAVIACLLVSGGVALFNHQFEGEVAGSMFAFRLAYPSFQGVLVVLAAAGVLGWLGAELAADRALRLLDVEYK